MASVGSPVGSPGGGAGGRLRRLLLQLSALATCLLLLCTCLLWTPPSPLYYLPAPTSPLREPDAPPATEQRLPDAIIIGVRKGGTRALIEFLSLHPGVATADDEQHFFDRDYSKGVDWYRGQMPAARPHQVVIEKTPAYFVTQDAPRRIRAMNNATKLLLIVRDPLVRLVSDYTQILSSRQAQGLPCRPFEQMVFEAGRPNIGYRAVQISLYAQHFRRWMQVFPPSQLHVVDGDRLIVNPAAELALVERFLGLHSALTPQHFYFNRTKGFYCMRQGANGTSDRCLGPSKGRNHPHIGSKTVRRLRRFFAPHNRLFFNMTGRTFDWPER